MDLPSFEYHVKNVVGDTHYNDHKHVLPDIHASLRARYLHTLNLGYKMPEALYHINLASRLPEKNYQRYIKYVLSTLSSTAYAGA